MAIHLMPSIRTSIEGCVTAEHVEPRDRKYMLPGHQTDARFSKYETLGDYHHREYAANTIYAAHARRVRNWITEHRVLDVGCGDGLITCLLRDKGHDVEGIDPNARAVMLAKRHGVRVRLGSVYRLPRGRWDAVYLGDVLEHLDHQKKAIRQIGRVTDTLYIATPLRGAQPADDYHAHEFLPGELREFMAALGWEQLSSEYLNFRILAKFRHRPRPWWRPWR